MIQCKSFCIYHFYRIQTRCLLGVEIIVYATQYTILFLSDQFCDFCKIFFFSFIYFMYINNLAVLQYFKTVLYKWYWLLYSIYKYIRNNSTRKELYTTILSVPLETLFYTCSFKKTFVTIISRECILTTNSPKIKHI